jgi:RHS repeat-associated protein
VTRNGTTVQTNYYDGAGQRVEQVAGDTMVYYYAGGNLVYEKDLTTGVATDHFFLGSTEVAKTVGGTAYYLTQDEVGSTRLEYQGTTQTFSSNYSPYGASVSQSGTEPWQFTGAQYDSVTGLYYMGARYYDPSTGRFLQEDSIGGTPSNSTSLNQYVYALDNPLGYTDPTGLNPLSDAWNWIVSHPSEALLLGTIVVASAVAIGATLGVDSPLVGAADAAAAAEITGTAVTVGAAAATDAIQQGVDEAAPDATTIASTIDSKLLNGALRAVANNLANPGPEETDGQAIGQWGQNALRPLMRLLGFTEEQYRIPTPKGDLVVDYYNPITKVAMDIKTGQGSLDTLQAVKYLLAQDAGQLSDVYYLNVPNPWTGTTGGEALERFAANYGFKLLPLFY